MTTIPAEITDRERTVWLAICAGRTARQIADELGIGVSGVNYIRSVLGRKLGARDTAALVRAAASAGLLDELPPCRVTPRPTAMAHW